MQELMHKLVMSLGGDVGSGPIEDQVRAATAVARLAATWCQLQDTKREIRGIPKLAVAQAVIQPHRSRTERLMAGYAAGEAPVE
jgi:hypothetical protein